MSDARRDASIAQQLSVMATLLSEDPSPEVVASAYGHMDPAGREQCREKGEHLIDCLMQVNRRDAGKSRLYVSRCTVCGGVFDSDHGSDPLNDVRAEPAP